MMTNTGKHLCDSGFGERGRAWQCNQIDYPTITDIENSNIIEIEQPKQWYSLKKDGGFLRRFFSENDALAYLQKYQPMSCDLALKNGYNIEKETLYSYEIDYTVSLYHHLTRSLEIDETCERFNKLPCGYWDSDKAYGICEKQAQWLEKNKLIIGDTWNSSNHESNLSQVVQGANVMVDGDALEYPTYILLQIHQGADVRGGYTDAKLFKVTAEYFTTNPTVYGHIDGTPVSTVYDGITLLSDGITLLSDSDDVQSEIDFCNIGDPVPVTPDSVINLYLNEY